MTHEELLNRIAQAGLEPYGNVMPTHLVLALRAVVELHKPVEEDGKLWCGHEECYNHIEFLERNNCYCSYPCPTIQAIEKQLK